MATTSNRSRSRSSGSFSPAARWRSSSSSSSEDLSPPRSPISHEPTISRTFKILYNDAYFRFSFTFSPDVDILNKKLKKALQERVGGPHRADFYLFWLDYAQSRVYGAGRVNPRVLKEYLNENSIVRLLLVIQEREKSPSTDNSHAFPYRPTTHDENEQLARIYEDRRLEDRRARATHEANGCPNKRGLVCCCSIRQRKAATRRYNPY